MVPPVAKIMVEGNDLETILLVSRCTHLERHCEEQAKTHELNSDMYVTLRPSGGVQLSRRARGEGGMMGEARAVLRNTAEMASFESVRIILSAGCGDAEQCM